MTDKEKETMRQSQEAIKEESKKVGASITKILMLGGPKMVQAILLSLQDANERIMRELNIDTKIDFQEGGK